MEKKNMKNDEIIDDNTPKDDVTEEKVDDKITSDNKLELTLKPAEKLADAIKQQSPQSQLILFKAEFKKTDTELVERAKDRMAKAQADFIIANDVSKKETGFESDFNKVAIVGTNIEVEWIEGSKIEIAKRIFNFILQ